MRFFIFQSLHLVKSFCFFYVEARLPVERNVSREWESFPKLPACVCVSEVFRAAIMNHTWCIIHTKQMNFKCVFILLEIDK